MLGLKSSDNMNLTGIFRKYLIFICFGLIYLLFKMLIAPQDIIDSFLRVLLVNIAFLSFIFIIDLIMVLYYFRFSTQFLIIYFLSGFGGLLLIDWWILGNFTVTSIIAQLFMFSYWSGAAIFPKLIVKEDKREGFYFDLFLWMGAILGLFICIGGLAYFFLQRPEFWQVSIMLFFITLNFYYWREFLINHEQEKEKILVLPDYVKTEEVEKTSENDSDLSENAN